jgi:Bacterial regulatory proteins, luxR family
VLRYLPINLLAPEIASELFLSVNTVRTHVQYLYEKPGAHSRTEAVARARALGLFAHSSGTAWSGHPGREEQVRVGIQAGGIVTPVRADGPSVHIVRACPC